MFENVGISGRELYFSLWIVVLTIMGAIGNYVYHKKMGLGLDTATIGSAIRAMIVGAFAGLLLVWSTQGGVGIGHWDIIPLALATGIASESIVGKFIGWNKSRKKDVPLDEELVETEKPKEKVTA